MRRYEKNSPEAAARFLVLAALADGELDRFEFSRLQESAELSALGVDEDLIDTVLAEFCDDIKRSQSVEDEYFKLKPSEIARLLADVDQPELQRALGRAALEVIGSDQRVHRGESVLMWAALDSWNLRLQDFLRRPASLSADRAAPSRFALHSG